MAKAKPFIKEDLLRAMRHTKSIRAAARYLGCSYQHLIRQSHTMKYLRIMNYVLKL